MSENMSAKTKQAFNTNQNDQSETSQSAPKLNVDLRAQKTDQQRERVTGLGSIRISKPAQKIASTQNDEFALDAQDDNKAQTSIGASIFLICTVIWAAYGVGFFIQSGIDTSPAGLATAFITLFGPPALLWYCLSQLKGGAGAQSAYAPNPQEFSGDVAAFYEQAQDISVMTKAVLKSLQRARQGLRVEMRDFSGVSKKAEFHIDRLASALQDKNEKLVTLTQDIESKVDVIAQKAQESTTTWDEAINTISARSQSIEDILAGGADKILSAANKAHEKTLEISASMEEGCAQLNDTVNDISSRLEDVGARFDTHADSLNTIVDHVDQETDRLTTSIKQQIDDLEAASGRTVASVIESATTITHHKEQMEVGVRDLYTQSERVSALIQKGVGSLKESVAYVCEQSSALEERFEARGQSLKETIDAISKQADLIETVGDEAANKLGESLSVAVGGAESISFAIRRAVDNLEDGAAKAQNKASQIVSDVTDTLKELQHSHGTNAERMEVMTNALRTSHQNLNDAVETASTQMNTLSQQVGDQTIRIEKAVTGLSSSVSGINASISSGVRDIQNVMSEVDSRQTSLESVISRRVADLHEASDKALKTADDIRASLRTQIQEISTLSAQLSGQGRRATDDLDSYSKQLDGSIQKALSDIEHVKEALAAQVRSVQEASSASNQDMEVIASTVHAHYESLRDWSSQAQDQLDGLDETLMAKLSALYDENSRTKDAFIALQDAVEQSAASIAPACADALNKADHVADRYNQLRETCISTTDSSALKFKQFGIILEDKIDALKQGGEETQAIMQRTQTALEEQSSNLKASVQSSSNDMDAAAERLRKQSDLVQLSSDQAILKMDSVQKEVNAHFVDFSESVANAIVDLESAGQAFTKQSERARDEIEDGINSFKTAGVKAREQAFMLTESTQKMSNDTDDIMDEIRIKMHAMLDETQTVLSDFKKTGDTITIRTRELGEQMRASLHTSEMYGREIKGQVSSIAGSSLEVAEQIGKAVSILNNSMDSIGRNAHDTTDQISGAREKLSIEADRLMQVSSAALDTTKEASDTFTHQSEALFKAVQDVQDNIRAIKHQEIKAERSAFLSSSRFIVESLHSLSVDVSRVLEGGDVSERAWQAFQRGDVSVFTRKLAELGESWPIEKAREKFKNDAEFRTYIQRFIRQFEEIYEQASANDHNALLGATIGSSDLAKLYGQLCKIAGKVSKISQIAA